MFRALSLVACAAIVAPAFAQEAPPPGFRALFNGQNLDGWWGASTEDPRGYLALPPDELAAKKAKSLEDIRKHWSVEDGILVNDGHGLFLTTEENFADFELRLEYRTVADADSGIYLRGVPQVQIWDTTEKGGKWHLGADKGSGGLWNNSGGAPGKDPLVLADRPFGEWNAVRVTMVGERVSVWLNGRLVVDHARMENYYDRARPIPREGPIQLQTHGGEIRLAQRLGARDRRGRGQSQVLLAGGASSGAFREAEGAKSDLRRSQSFAGWAGPDGQLPGRGRRRAALQARARGHDLLGPRSSPTSRSSSRSQLPPGGNNGLAIRYPGEGDTAYVGMCELQVLDDSAPPLRPARPAPVPRLGLRPGRGGARLPARAGGMEPPARHRQRPVDHRRAERLADPARRHQRDHRLHDRPGEVQGPQPNERLLRPRGSQRSRAVPPTAGAVGPAKSSPYETNQVRWSARSIEPGPSSGRGGAPRTSPCVRRRTSRRTPRRSWRDRGCPRSGR